MRWLYDSIYGNLVWFQVAHANDQHVLGKGSILTREISSSAFPVCRADSREGICVPVKTPDVLASRIGCVEDRQRRSELDQQGLGAVVHDRTWSGTKQDYNCHTYVSEWH